MLDRKFSADSCMCFWTELANVTRRAPIWPRRCELSGRWLWLKPALRGDAGYPMRSGRWVSWTEWMDPQALEDFKLEYYRKYGEYVPQGSKKEFELTPPVRIAPTYS